MLLTDEEMRKVLAARAKGGKMVCSEALEIARETKTPAKRLGQMLDDMGIQVVGCQLGCFD